MTEPVGPRITHQPQLLCCRAGPYVQGSAVQDCESADHMLCEPWRTLLTEALRAGKANPCLEHVWIPVKTKLSTSGGTRGSVLPAAPSDCSESLELLGPTVRAEVGKRARGNSKAGPGARECRAPGSQRPRSLHQKSRWPAPGQQTARWRTSPGKSFQVCSFLQHSLRWLLPICCHCNLQSSLLLGN